MSSSAVCSFLSPVSHGKMTASITSIGAVPGSYALDKSYTRHRYTESRLCFTRSRVLLRKPGRNSLNQRVSRNKLMPRCCDSSSYSPDLASEPVFETSREPYVSPSEAISLDNIRSQEGEAIPGIPTWTPPVRGIAQNSSQQSPESVDDVRQSPTLQALTKAGIEIVESLEKAESEVLKAMQKADLSGSVFETESHLLEEFGGNHELNSDTAQLPRLVINDEQRFPETFGSISGKGVVSVNADEWKPGSLLRDNEIASRFVISEVAERLPSAGSQNDMSKRGVSSTIVLPNILSGDETSVLGTSESKSSLGSLTLHQPSQDVVEQTVTKDPTVMQQMKMILGFAGPALVIWLASPLMSLIDTAVIGQSSSIELAALGPGTVVCDQISNLFMFLSVATSNLIATSMAQRDVEEAGKHLSRLLFVALSCGVFMTIFTHFCAPAMIRGFVGNNLSVIPAATTYAAIRGLAWPAVLITSVAQSASLGMQDAWGPLYVLVTASLINLFGDILLCSFLGWGIAGAAWATMVSQYVGCILMLVGIHRARAIRLSMSIPSPKDLRLFIKLAAPILLTMLGKTSFYTILTKVATSLGTVPCGAHQVMIGLFAVCAVCGEPLSQTAQSYIPGLKTGKNRNLKQARTLLKSLLIFGVILGLIVGGIAATVPFLAPNLFTQDIAIIAEMRKLAAPLHLSLLLTPIVLSLEGTLLAGRDFGFLATSMLSSLAGSIVFVLAGQMLGMGIVANWWTLVCFQAVRMVQAGLRLSSSKSILLEDEMSTIPLMEPLLTT